MDPASLEQALAGLRDIHSPPPPGYWPLALGWWLLIAAAILLPITSYLLARWIKARRERLRVKKLALLEHQQLQQAWDNNAEADATVSAVALLMRRAALAKFGHAATASLTDQSWLVFLQDKAPDLDWGDQAAWLLDQRFSAHQPTADDATYCLAVSKHWLEAAL